MRLTTAAIGAIGLLGGMATAINIIEIKDRHFIDSTTGKEFFVCLPFILIL
jgi:1,3-beta-glucanosyltransferase GAS4